MEGEVQSMGVRADTGQHDLKIHVTMAWGKSDLKAT